MGVDHGGGLVRLKSGLTPEQVGPALEVAVTGRGEPGGLQTGEDPVKPGHDPYPSAAQPPPFSWNPVPPLMSRLAASLPQAGHFFSGGSLIFWDCSQAWPHSVHWYSYVMSRNLTQVKPEGKSVRTTQVILHRATRNNQIPQAATTATLPRSGDVPLHHALRATQEPPRKQKANG